MGGMKRFLLSLAVVAASAAYVLYQGLGGGGPAAPAVAATPPAAATQQGASLPVASSATRSAPPSAPRSALASATKSAGQYADGTYVGTSANAYYGMVQVQAAISGGKLTGVTFLSYPSDRSTSRYINAQAMPYLTQEALQVQGANVDIVSGATDTSLAFRQSLASALAQAKG